MRSEGERGSVLVLMPAAVLVVVVLAAITVDLSARFLAQREAIAAAEAAANDAVAAGVDLGSLNGAGPPLLDPEAVRRIALRSLEAQGVLDHVVAPPEVTLADPTTVMVRLTLSVDGIFAPVVPGAGGSERFVVTASARLVAR